MKYVSTRDASVSVDGATAVIEGISREGGLFVPESIPKLSYKDMLGADYASRCDKVLNAFFDFDTEGVAQKAYEEFDGEPAPVIKLDDNLFVLELWHGKTRAFKDMALSVLPRLLVKAKAQKGDPSQTLVLVATSGDTGKAALEGFKDVNGTSVCVFYPTDGVSRVQKLAMQTQEGGNVNVVGVNGNFDDAQTAVKAALSDDCLKRALAENNISLSSANSINIGRLVPQIAYYFSAYCDLADSGEITAGDKVDFVVPTGNFGNILAGWYAREMGLPIAKLVCASNANNVLSDFFDTGDYDVNREFYKTESPSMDILVSSNLERLLFETSGRDAALTAERMQSLKQTGRYSVAQAEMEKIREVFAGDYADDEDSERAISDMFDEYGYLIDTHTAAAYAVAERRELVRPTVIVSTADPYKFAPAVLGALGEDADDKSIEDAFDALEQITAMEIPERLKAVFVKSVRFDTVIEPDDIPGYVLRTYKQ